MEEPSEYDKLIGAVAEAQLRYNRAQKMLQLAEQGERDARLDLADVTSRLNRFNGQRVGEAMEASK